MATSRIDPPMNAQPPAVSKAPIMQARRTALLLGCVALGFYVAFILTTAFAR